jgi:dolichol kinase
VRTFPGRATIYYVLGCALALAFFAEEIALAGIMVLALGDSVSHLAGRLYGRRKHPFNGKKLLEGWLVGIIAGFLGAWIFVRPLEAMAGAAVAMTAETLEWGVDKRILDDNLFIPTIAAIVITLLRMI